jgi:hypothetical protein
MDVLLVIGFHHHPCSLMRGGSVTELDAGRGWPRSWRVAPSARRGLASGDARSGLSACGDSAMDEDRRASSLRPERRSEGDAETIWMIRSLPTKRNGMSAVGPVLQLERL